MTMIMLMMEIQLTQIFEIVQKSNETTTTITKISKFNNTDEKKREELTTNKENRNKFEQFKKRLRIKTKVNSAIKNIVISNEFIYLQSS